MQIHKYSEHENENLEAAMRKGEPMLAVISFDCEQAYMGHIDECVEHHILLTKVGLPSTDIDKYFRIIFDNEEVNWTFICPPDYKSIADRTRRVAAFYKDGFTAISEFIVELGLLADIRIPKRYRRHIDALKGD